jgi:hypothetical protein
MKLGSCKTLVGTFAVAVAKKNNDDAWDMKGRARPSQPENGAIGS